MKTTLVLPEELLLAMRQQAAQEGREFEEVVEDTIRRGLSRRPQPSKGKERQEIELPLFPCAPGAPASRMSLAELLALEQLSLNQEESLDS